MREKFLELNLNYINSKTNYDKRKLMIIKYGLECIYTLITKLSVIFIISIIIGTFKETLLLIIFYTFLRMFGFGIHATSNIGCWITSLTVYIVFPLFIKYIYVNQLLLIILEVISIIGFFLWCPADTKKRPMIHSKKRLKNKIIVITISLFYLAYSIFYFNEFSKSILIAMLIQLVCACPLTYKICHQPYNNYKNFK